MAKILLIDDDEIWCHLLARRLERESFSVDYTVSAEAALEKIAEAHPAYDILLIDYELGPGPNGLDLLRQMRGISPDSDAIFITGLDEQGVGLRAYQAGAYRYLLKPFEPQELILIIQSLLNWREAGYERGWLRTLNDVASELQRANTVAEVGKVLVDGGIRLGFDRSRFYQIREMNGVLILCGVCQGGTNQTIGFNTIMRPIDKTIYSKIAYEQRSPTFFNSRQLGPSILSEHQAEGGLPDSLGEWVSIPLFSGESCLGILNMDNCQKVQNIHPVQKNHLHLFSGQAASALERAIRYEKTKYENNVEKMVSQILKEMGDPAEENALRRLLLAIREEMTTQVSISNFLVVFKSRDTDGFYTRLHIDHDLECKPYWRSNSEPGMIGCMLNYGHPLFCPQGTAEHRKKYNLKQIGEREAQSWMGVPLRIGEQVVGTLIAEDDDRKNLFQEEDFVLFQSLADRLAGVIQTAWLNEQEQTYGELLRRLQQASEMITGFDEEKLWLTTLTLCTANYGASFDRAMLFLVQDGGTRLNGRMAIGHLNLEDAQADWEHDERVGMNWKMFLTNLKSDNIGQTPLNDEVNGYSFNVESDTPESNAFAEILKKHEIIVLSKQDAQLRLPATFTARFGTTSYCLVPVKAADRMIGVVILDNIWEKNPQLRGALSILDNLTNQAALLYEGILKTQALEQLISVHHEALILAAERPLRVTLKSICTAVKNISGAHLTAIYPLKDNGDGEILYDHSHSAQVGRDRFTNQPPSHKPSGLTRHTLITARQPIYIQDILQDQTLYDGERIENAPIVKQEGIRAAIAVPIFGQRTKRARAILHIDYHTPQTFTEHDKRIAEAFAHLIATAIGSWRNAQGLRDEREARDEELHKLSQTLTGVLEAAQNEDPEKAEERVVELLLEAVPELFGTIEVTAGITLKGWERKDPKQDPVEMHHYFYPLQSGIKNKSLRRTDDTGINSRAMTQNKIQNIANAPQDKNYRPRAKGSATLSELDVPIELDGRVIGAFNIESSQFSAFTKHHEEMAKRFASVATLALGNVRRQRNLLTILNATKEITTPSDLPTTLRLISNGVRRAVPNLSTLTIWYTDPESRGLRLADSYFGVRNEKALLEDTPREKGMVRFSMQHRKPLWITDVNQDRRFASKPFVQDEGIRSTAVFPLWAQDQAVGVMFFSYRESHIFTDEEKFLYPILAKVVAASIQDALLLTQAQQERKRFRLALDVTEAVGAELDQEKAIKKVLMRLQEDDLFPNTTAAILRYDEDNHSLVFTSSSLPFYFPENPDDPSVPNVPVDGRSIVADVARRSLRVKNKERINEKHVQNNPEYLNVRPDTQSELAISLWSDEKGLIGVLVLESTQLNAFNEDAELTASLLAKQIRLAMERALERDELEINNTVAAATAWGTEIAHDIEQEIYHIRSSVEALRNPSTTGQPTEHYLAVIDESAQRLIAATPPESQTAESFPIDDYLYTVVSNSAAEIDESIKTDFAFCCEGLEIEGYPLALERILRHLVRNAREAMKDQTTRKVFRVETELLGMRDQIVIRISDTGPGIPPDRQHQIFRRRFSRNENGHGGLGLMLVHFLVKTIGGSIRILPSQPGWGATFAILLPLQPPSNTTYNPEA